MKTTNALLGVTAVVVIAATTLIPWGADSGPRLDTRTFHVAHLAPHEVEPLIAPYVYHDRASNPGTFSVSEGAVTVRETADNLARIERVLAEFDKASPAVRLHFQLIEADGFTESDARIAAVEEELRRLFDFRGYRLAGEATITAANESSVRQELDAAGTRYAIRGNIWSSRSQATRLDVELSSMDGTELATTVTIRPGQTVVLGSAPKAGSKATLFLTVRAERAGGPS